MTSDELYNRLLSFAKRNQKLIKILPNTVYNREYSEQLIRTSASSGANYIEALEATSQKDFVYKLKICRKETKESTHWLDLIQSSNEESIDLKKETQILINEAREYIRIFTASILTSERNSKLKISK